MFVRGRRRAWQSTVRHGVSELARGDPCVLAKGRREDRGGVEAARDTQIKFVVPANGYAEAPLQADEARINVVLFQDRDQARVRAQEGADAGLPLRAAVSSKPPYRFCGKGDHSGRAASMMPPR